LSCHCRWIVCVGHKTSAGTPIRRTISRPTIVLPDPGGATISVFDRPAARSASNASRQSSW
jgi:hypothetical protein